MCKPSSVILLAACIAGCYPSETETDAAQRRAAVSRAEAELQCDSITALPSDTNTGWTTSWAFAGCGRDVIESCTGGDAPSSSATCSTQLTGSITIGGVAFAPITCFSGSVEAESFFGVDLDDGVRTLRLAQAVDGSDVVVIIDDADGSPTAVTSCARFQLATDDPGDDVPTVSGAATLQCGSGGTALAGEVTFTSC